MRNSAAGREPVVDHVERRARDRRRREREDAQHDEPEVRHRRVRDEPHEVLLPDREQRRRTGSRSTASTMITGAAQRDAFGNSGRHSVSIPNVPTLSSTPTSSVEVPGGRLLRGVRQPGVHREHRRLDGERQEERAGTCSFSAVGSSVETREVLREEALRTARSLQVQGDDRDQHDQAAGQRVEQELHGRVPPLRPAEQADHEVDRDEHGLEQDVEEEHVPGREHRDDERLEQQHEREVPAQLVGGHRERCPARARRPGPPAARAAPT